MCGKNTGENREVSRIITTPRRTGPQRKGKRMGTKRKTALVFLHYGHHCSWVTASSASLGCFLSCDSAHFACVKCHCIMQIWPLQSPVSVCVCVCTSACVCVCVSHSSLPHDEVIDSQHWARISSEATTHLNEYENFKPPLHSLPQLLWSPFKNLRLSKHERMYAFMHMNSPSKGKGTAFCLLSH